MPTRSEPNRRLRLGVAWDFLLIALSVFSIGVIAYVELEGLTWEDPAFQRLAVIDLGIVLLLAIDLMIGFWRAPSKGAWLRMHWYEIPALTPLYAEAISFLRLAQLLRVARVLRLLRAASAFRRTRTSIRFFDDLLNRTKMAHALVIAAGLVIAMAAIVYMLERDTNPHLNSFADALWWAIVTATTVGYGDITPQTGLARMFATVLMVMGIGTVGVVASSVSAALLHTQMEEDAAAAGGEFGPVDLVAQLERLAQLHARGVLTDAEFSTAKQRVLHLDAGAGGGGGTNSAPTSGAPA